MVDEGFERLVDPIQVVVMEASCVVNVSVCMLVNKQWTKGCFLWIHLHCCGMAELSQIAGVGIDVPDSVGVPRLAVVGWKPHWSLAIGWFAGHGFELCYQCYC